MLLWSGWRWLRGTVTCHAQGGLCERFLSLLRDADPSIAVWHIRRDDAAVTLCCRAADYKRLRPLARRTGTRLHVVRKSGLPFVTHAVYKRQGILIGAVIALMLYVLLSNRVWVIDVQTDDPVLVSRIEARLRDSGVTIGSRIRDIDVPRLRMHAIAEIEEINQLSLYFDGSIARVGVQLQKSSASPPNTTPANIVASADGRILSMRTTIGVPLVMTGEAVVKGDLLVCGAVETENGTLLRHATAEILAETTHTFTQTVTKQELTEQIGRVIEQPSLRILSWCVPLYSHAAMDDTWTVVRHKRLLTACGTTLPLGIESDIYAEHTLVAVTYSDAEAEQLANERLAARIATELSDAQITDTVLTGEWDGDTYRLHAVCRCVEDIAQTIPLTILS